MDYLTRPCQLCAKWRRGLRRLTQRKDNEGTVLGKEHVWDETNPGMASGLHPWGTCYGVPPSAQVHEDADAFPCTHEEDSCPNWKNKAQIKLHSEAPCADCLYINTLLDSAPCSSCTASNNFAAFTPKP